MKFVIGCIRVLSLGVRNSLFDRMSCYFVAFLKDIEIGYISTT